MKNYDSEVLYEMYKKKCEQLDRAQADSGQWMSDYASKASALEEAISIIKDLGECGISGRREREFLKKMGIETEPKYG